MTRRFLGTVFLCLCLPALSWAQVKLDWKFHEGDTFFVESQTTMDSTMATLNPKDKSRLSEIQMKTVHTEILRFKVLKKTEAGYFLEARIELVADKSAGVPVGPDMAAVLKAMKGLAYKFTLRPDGEVTRVEGLEAANKKAAASPFFPKKFGPLLSETSLKNSLKGIFFVFPRGEVKEGTTWEQNLQDKLGRLGSFEGHYTFTYRGKGKEGDRINVKAALKYLPPEARGGVPFGITGADLKADQVAGTILFNNQAGRLIRSELKMHFQGTLTFEIKKMKFTTLLIQDQVVTVRFLDKNPLVAAPAAP